MATLRKEKFIFVESNENHNKVWYIEELDNCAIKTIWGRVGNNLAENIKTFESQEKAEKEYDKLVKAKTKKGYTKLRTIDSDIINDGSKDTIQKKRLEEIALNEIDYDKNDADIKNMIQVFCGANIHSITANTNITFNADNNVFQTPCGIVTLEAINDARTILNEIYDLIQNDNFNSEFTSKVEKYCSIIPQKIHGKLICRNIFSTIKDVQKQNDVLDALKDSIETINELNKTNITKTTEKLFNCSIKKVTDMSIIDKIKKFFNKTHQNVHACRNLKIKTVYAIDINSMTNNYNTTKNKWLSDNKNLNVMQLWHGTKKQNIISILKNGMIIPPANASYCCGRMFGNYIYLSDQSTKSLNYAYGWWSGTRDSNCYMFLNEVLMGKAYTPTGWGGCSKIPTGYDSMLAKAGISGVQNNEMMVMPNQILPKYLIEFSE